MEASMIIKALECYQETMICAVVENNRTHFITNADALALIKELTEEVESWKKECASRTTVYCELHSKCEKLTEENEKLGIDNFDLICELSRIKENTLRDLQLELSMHFGTYKTDDAIKISDLFKLMDNITDKLIDNNTEDN